MHPRNLFTLTSAILAVMFTASCAECYHAAGVRAARDAEQELMACDLIRSLPAYKDYSNHVTSTDGVELVCYAIKRNKLEVHISPGSGVNKEVWLKCLNDPSFKQVCLSAANTLRDKFHHQMRMEIYFGNQDNGLLCAVVHQDGTVETIP